MINQPMSNVPLRNGKIPVAVNSDWLVVLAGDTINRTFAIYSLDVIKRSSQAVIHPVTELKVQTDESTRWMLTNDSFLQLPTLEIYDFFVDETQIVFFEKCAKEIHLIDFLDCTSVVQC